MADDERAEGETWFAAHITVWARICFGLGGLGVVAAGGLLSATSWMTRNPWWTERAPVFAVAAMAAGLIFVTLAGFSVMQHAPRQNRSEYAPFIFGLGILMAAVGGTGVVGVAGLIHAQQLPRLESERTSASGDDTADGAAIKAAENAESLRAREERRARFVLLAGAMAFVGSLFYIALALWRKQHHDVHREDFDVGKLVSGAALRCGEAMLFTLVFVLLTQVGGSFDFDGWLPVMGLMLGMFVKSGERLVFNLATRVFDLAETIVPSARRSGAASEELEADELDGPDPTRERRVDARSEESDSAPAGTNGTGAPEPSPPAEEEAAAAPPPPS